VQITFSSLPYASSRAIKWAANVLQATMFTFSKPLGMGLKKRNSDKTGAVISV
jgi:hypothetical protein